jgi:hypothetical protein
MRFRASLARTREFPAYKTASASFSALATARAAFSISALGGFAHPVLSRGRAIITQISFINFIILSIILFYSNYYIFFYIIDNTLERGQLLAEIK